MAKFLTGNNLNAELEKIFEDAEDRLILISPYIKLHERYASSLRAKKDNYNLEITIVFGKNEEDISRSMKEEDFNFFKEFPNIEIRYEKRLHAKYYANEFDSILTSMNLYSYSQDNNIEAGVLTKFKFIGTENFDYEASEYFSRVIKQSALLFKKTPQIECTMLGLKKTYIESMIEVDELTNFFRGNKKLGPGVRGEAYERVKNDSIKIESKKILEIGYCIRTGKQIPFNPKQPMSDEALKSWKKFSNEEYPEKYCHYSGEPSNGDTTFAKPILHKNWSKANINHK